MVYGLNKDIGFDISIDDFADLVMKNRGKNLCQPVSPKSSLKIS